jgi:hypothetical protein
MHLVGTNSFKCMKMHGLANPKFAIMFTTVRQNIPIINLIYLVHIITYYSFMVNFNIILSYTLTYAKRSRYIRYGKAEVKSSL